MALKIELKVASPLLRISTVLFRERRALLLFRVMSSTVSLPPCLLFQQFGFLDTLFLVFAHVLQPLEVAQAFHGEHLDLPVVHAEIDVKEQPDTGGQHEYEYPRKCTYRISVFQYDRVYDRQDGENIQYNANVNRNTRPVHAIKFSIFNFQSSIKPYLCSMNTMFDLQQYALQKLKDTYTEHEIKVLCSLSFASCCIIQI